MIRLNKELIEEIKRHARENYPSECGGFLAGKNNLAKEITAVYSMRNTNALEASRRFEIDPKELQRVEKEAAQKGLNLLVFYHSHPDTPLRANPSGFDRERAEGLSPIWPELSWLIVSVEKGNNYQLACWTYNFTEGKFEEEKIEVV